MRTIPIIQVPSAIPAGSAVVRTPLLAGEISGVETFLVAAPPGVAWQPIPERGKIRAVFFLTGEGDIASLTLRARFRNPAFLVPPVAAPLCVQASTRGFTAFETLVKIYDAEEKEILSRGNPALFLPYADCATYREAIKSEKTINRTLIPENLLPRFCMGSVETTGPDRVAAHTHPQWEQLFFGLPGNQSVVTADDAETRFGENTLLHIPLGASHGVRVNAGHSLHYLWLDFFMRQEDMHWISELHTSDK